jgi:Na+-driven multidrug efflux pump
MTDPDVLRIGIELLRYLAISGFFIVIALTYTGGLQGTGDTRSPLYISLISQVVIPLGMCSIFEATTGLQSSYVWLAIVLGHFSRGTLSFLRFRQGKWAEIKVEVAPERS